MKRRNYQQLLKNWMQFYELTAERSKKMFASIWLHLQNSKTKGGEENDGLYLEQSDRAGEA